MKISKTYLKFLTIFTLIIFTSCSQKQVKSTSTNIDIDTSSSIPLVCEVEIDEKVKNPKFAFVGFINNTPFKAIKKNSPDKDILEQALNEEFVALAKSTGYEIIDFTNLKLIQKQQKLQTSGLFKEETTPELGKLEGSKYVLRGSIDNIYIEKKDNSTLKKGLMEHLGAPGWIIKSTIEKFEKRKIEIKLSLKLINNETGKTIFQKTVNVKSAEKFDYDRLPEKYEAIKKVALKGLKKLTKEIDNFYPLRAKIVKVSNEGDNYYIFINKGKINSIKKGDIFKIYLPKKVYLKDENIDICNFIKLPIKLKIIDVKDKISIGIPITNNIKLLKIIKSNFLVEKI